MQVRHLWHIQVIGTFPPWPSHSLQETREALTSDRLMYGTTLILTTNIIVLAHFYVCPVQSTHHIISSIHWPTSLSTSSSIRCRDGLNTYHTILWQKFWCLLKQYELCRATFQTTWLSMDRKHFYQNTRNGQTTFISPSRQGPQIESYRSPSCFGPV